MKLLDFKHVIWDWNGTLFDDAWLCMDCMNTLLRRRALPELTSERYQQVFDFPVIEYYRRLGFDFEKESFEKLGSEFMAEYERRRLECNLRENARDVLSAIRDRGLTQSVLSAYRQDTLHELLEHFRVKEFFAGVIGADDHYAHGKMERGLSWIRELGVSPGEVLLVGDTVHDYEVAREMGAQCWLLPCGNHSKEKLVTCGVPVLDSLEELLDGIS